MRIHERRSAHVVTFHSNSARSIGWLALFALAGCSAATTEEPSGEAAAGAQEATPAAGGTATGVTVRPGGARPKSVSSCSYEYANPSAFVELSHSGNASAWSDGKMVATAAGTGGSSTVTLATQALQITQDYTGWVAASATVEVDQAYVSAPFGAAAIRLEIDVTDEGGNVVCAPRVFPIAGSGAGTNNWQGTESLSCYFQKGLGSASYQVNVTLETDASLVWDSTSASMQVTASSVDSCVTVSNVVDAQSGKCLDVSYADPAPQTPVGEFTCLAGAQNEGWQFQPNGLLVGLDGMCLNVPIWGGNWNPADGIGVQIYPCTYPLQTNETWTYDPASGELRGLNGKCLTSLDEQNGTQLVMWTCGQHAGQDWTFQ
jgi:hypothetical protein